MRFLNGASQIPTSLPSLKKKRNGPLKAEPHILRTFTDITALEIVTHGLQCDQNLSTGDYIFRTGCQLATLVLFDN